jgi:hypothetical protein
MPKAPPAGSVLVDLSQRQGQWQNLTSYLRQSHLNLTEIASPFTAKTLANPRGSVLILPLPFHEHLADSKISAIKTWVERGGGLLVLGHYAADMHHGSNPSALTRTWGLKLAPGVLLPADAGTCDRGHAFDRSQKFAVTIPMGDNTHPIARNVDGIFLVSSTWIDTSSATIPLDWSLGTRPDVQVCVSVPIQCTADQTDCSIEWTPAPSASLPVLVALKSGAGRVVVLGTWKAVNPGLPQNRILLQNLVSWLQGKA